jgi:tRNA A22 N-methylase
VRPDGAAVIRLDNESDRIYHSAIHLAVAMRLALCGKSSLSEVREYLNRNDLNATEEQIIDVIEEYKSYGYLQEREGRYEAASPLVELVKRSAPSKEHLESKAKPLAI